MKTRFSSRHAFTLTELMVGMGVLVLMFGFLMSATNQMVRTMSNTSAKVEQFRGARDAFERITGRLAQATLNTYWDYVNTKNQTGTQLPQAYGRASDLRFLSGYGADILGTIPGKKISHAVFYCAPLGQVSQPQNNGMVNLLNVCGYYVEYNKDSTYRPKFIGTEVPDRFRWRLMENVQPSENFWLYSFTSTVDGPGTKYPKAAYSATSWITGTSITAFQNNSRPVVENVIALILTPRLARVEETPLQAGNKDYSPLAKDYKYDSTKTVSNAAVNPHNQLPPVMQVTMVAIDEKSAERLSLGTADSDMFNVNARFKDTNNFSKDLYHDSGSGTSLEDDLIKQRVGYRIFTTNVHLRASKWSRQQTN